MLDDIGAANYIGDSADRTGFSGLEEVEDVTMVAVPDLMAAYEQGAIDLETVKGVQLAVDRALRADGRPDGGARPAAAALSAQDVAKWRRIDAGLRLEVRGALLPVDQGARPGDRARTRFIPPSGHIAGVWARNDNERGVHKAPANEIVRGAIEVQTQIDPHRAGDAQPDRRQRHPQLPGPRHPRLGCPHAVERPGLAVRQHPPALQLPREVDPERDAVRGLRAERPRAVGQAQPVRSRASSSASGARARCSGGRPTRPST